MSKTIGLTIFTDASNMNRDDIAEQLDSGFNFWTHEEMVVQSTRLA